MEVEDAFFSAFSGFLSCQRSVTRVNAHLKFNYGESQTQKIPLRGEKLGEVNILNRSEIFANLMPTNVIWRTDSRIPLICISIASMSNRNEKRSDTFSTADDDAYQNNDNTDKRDLALSWETSSRTASQSKYYHGNKIATRRQI